MGAASLWLPFCGQRVRQVAAGLAGLGVGRGATVGMMMANQPEPQPEHGRD
jgi:long-chain acyl-CoA synthetase